MESGNIVRPKHLTAQFPRRQLYKIQKATTLAGRNTNVAISFALHPYARHQRQTLLLDNSLCSISWRLFGQQSQPGWLYRPSGHRGIESLYSEDKARMLSSSFMVEHECDVASVFRRLSIWQERKATRRWHCSVTQNARLKQRVQQHNTTYQPLTAANAHQQQWIDTPWDASSVKGHLVKSTLPLKRRPEPRYVENRCYDDGRVNSGGKSSTELIGTIVIGPALCFTARHQIHSR
jgi:hypothetical protein